MTFTTRVMHGSFLASSVLEPYLVDFGLRYGKRDYLLRALITRNGENTMRVSQVPFDCVKRQMVLLSTIHFHSPIAVEHRK
jgi:hypothetical protein